MEKPSSAAKHNLVQRGKSRCRRAYPWMNKGFLISQLTNRAMQYLDLIPGHLSAFEANGAKFSSKKKLVVVK